MVITAQALPNLAGLIFTAYAFKFAKLAEMNQGCIPSLFTATSIYIAVLFYFKFNEKLTVAQISGIAIMIPCVILLSIDKKVDGESSNDLTVKEMKMYGLYAVLMGLCGPICWTIQSYYLRLSIERKSFGSVFDLSIDTMLFQGLIQTLMYAVYMSYSVFKWNELIEGAVTGVLFFLGTIFSNLAYETGPGGPINALCCTQIIYQSAINAIFFG